MRTIVLPGINRPVSCIALGGRFGEVAEDLSFALLDEYSALGGNIVDTAHSYAEGQSERLIGRWIASRRNRQAIIVVDKGCHPDEFGRSRLSARDLHQDIDESLARLETDYIDLFLLHRDDPTVPLGPLLEALNDELSRGRIRAFGASNWHHIRLVEAANYATAHGIAGFCVSSSNFSLAKVNEPMWPGCMSLDQDARDWYRAQQLPLLAWSSQARGWFTGRYAAGMPSGSDSSDIDRVYRSAENYTRLERANQVAAKYFEQPGQVALAYVLNQPFPVVAIIGPETLEQLRTSARAANLTLTAADLLFLESGIPSDYA